MSNISLHSPLVSFVGIDSLPFRPSHARPPTTSAPQVINLVDDDADTNAPPPAVRRRLAGPVPDDDVVIVDPDTGTENSTTGGRRISIGGVNRPIIIPDSDEEHSPTRNAHFGPSTSTHHQRRDSYRIFSPPPPAPTYHPVPPVPSLPIIANPQPFAILAPPANNNNNTNNNASSSRSRLPFDEPPQPDTAVAFRGGHRPGIHLGGGLVSQGIRPRRGARSGPQTNDAARSAATSSADGAPLPVARIVATFLNHDQQQQHERNLDPNQNQNQDFNPHHYHPQRFHPVGSWFNPRRAGRIIDAAYYFLTRHPHHEAAIAHVPEYTKDMTHPGMPPPGWSFSFGTESVQSVDDDDEGGAASGAPAEYLACALCLDPLHANVEESRDLSAEEKRKKKVWALRCGHMFDGKCIESLMVPNWQKEKPKVTPVEEVKTEEKVVVVADDEDLVKDKPARDKGKGKAKEENEDAAEPPAVDVVDVVESAPQSMSTPVVIDDTPSSSQPGPASGSRYNLRTRRPPPPPPEQPTSSRSNRRTRGGTASAAAPAAAEPSRKTRGTKRKHDGKNVKNNEPSKIEIRYNWTCPVAACGMLHSSYKLHDVWKPDEENGPIAIYI